MHRLGCVVPAAEMKIGFDYWNVCSAYPRHFATLARSLIRDGHEVHVISAVGASRAGTIEDEVIYLSIPYTEVHVVVFGRPSESPSLKLAKCQELGIGVFYDDREDVVALLAAHGILAFRVPRGGDDIETERG